MVKPLPSWLNRILSGNLHSSRKGLRPYILVCSFFLALGSSAALAAPGVSITGQNWFCPGSSTILTASVSGCSGSASYLWRRNGVFMPGASSASISVTDPGTYTVAVTCGGSTVTSAAFNLTRLNLKANVQNACPGSLGSINLQVLDGKAPFTYAWNTGASTQDVAGLVSGNYSVAVTDGNGCVATTSATVRNTVVNVSAGNPASICLGNSAQLNATGADLYFWSPATGLSATNVSDPVATPATNTLYTVKGYVASGELVNNGDFRRGNTGFGSDYGYVTGFATGDYSTGTGLYPEARYAIVANRTDTNVTKYHPAFVGSGRNGGVVAGRNDDKYMAVNGSTTLDQVVWKQSVEVVPGNTYSFSCWITSILTDNPSKLRFLINGVELGPQIVAPSTLYTWKQFFTEWNSGTNTRANIAIINDNIVAGGNDFGLDDISFSTFCTNTSTVLVTVNPALGSNVINCPSVNTFCLSGNAGIITASNPSGGDGNYSYQWQISVNNGTTWSNIPDATSASYDPGTVFATTRYRRMVMSGACSLASNVCTITITAGNTISGNSITAPSTAAFCESGNPTAINGSAPSGGGGGTFVYSWLSSTNGNDFDLIPNASAASYDPGTLTSSTFFRRVVSKGNCNSNASNIVAITINPKPQITLVSSANICGSGSATLEVSSPGATFSWFGSLSSTTSIGTGATFTTPVLTAPATYFAQARLNNCPSDRLAVTADVVVRPTVVSVTNGKVCGISDATAGATASAGTINWYSAATEGTLLGSGNSLVLNNVSFTNRVYAEAVNGSCTSAGRTEALVEFNLPTSSETTESACKSFTWNGETYTQSGDYTKILVNTAGCDSTAILHLTIRKATSSETTESACKSFTWNGETYTQSGDYTKILVNTAGCDSTAILHLTIRKATSASVNQTIATGATFNFFGQVLSSAGTYTATIPNRAGCDSLITLTLQVTPAPPSGCNSLHAMSVAGFRQGKRNDGSSVPAERSIPELALGAPQNNNTLNFVSLGFGGEITLKFCKAVKNGPGADLRVTETTFGGNFTCSANPEKVRIFVSQDGCRFVYLGEGCQDSEFDLGSLPWVEFVRLIDNSPRTGSTFAGQILGDGFDVDGITALNGFEANPVADVFVPGASEVTNYSPRKRKNGTDISSDRKVASRALGLPQRTDVVNFVSLGFQGSLTLKFKYLVMNNPTATDLQVVETSYGNVSCNAYPEKATFEGSLDGLQWVSLGELCQDGTLEIGPAGNIHFLRITDASNPALFNSTADGYDVDGVVAINQPCGTGNGRVAIGDLVQDDNETADEEAAGTLSPNPAAEQTTLRIENGREGEVWNVRVLDITGKVVTETSFTSTGYLSELPLQVGHLLPGVYQVSVLGASSRFSFKLVH